MSIKIRCLVCGHCVDLGDAYEDYEGVVRCFTCSGVMQVVLHEGKLRSMQAWAAETRSE